MESTRATPAMNVHIDEGAWDRALRLPMSAEMTTTNNVIARLARLTMAGLLAVALTLALPGAADAKKRPHKKCTAAHTKGHKAKRTRCVKPVARRRGSGRSPSAPKRSGGQTNTSAAPASDEVSRCQREQAQDPAGFADLYGVGAEDEGAFENCVTASDDNSSTEGESTEDSG